MSDTKTKRFRLSEDDKPIVFALLFVVLILAVGTAYTLQTQGTATLLSPTYLLQQLQVGAFLGVVAAGMMLVILLGHIDLSVPWTIAAAAMMATTVGGPMAIPVGLAVGLLVGLINGFGVAFLRIPSMIFTLGVNAVLRGLMVAHTGGFAPQTTATPLMQYLAVNKIAGTCYCCGGHWWYAHTGWAGSLSRYSARCDTHCAAQLCLVYHADARSRSAGDLR